MRTQELTALLYAIEASSVASTRYFLKLKTEKWFINTKEESAYRLTKVLSFIPYLMKGRYRVLSVSF